ncbi:flavodoxin [Allobacillus halotolerans]|uniref:Flavodoxin n=1 Tax=Allobacillus halotolerans TaxID=570278 RepID=A0ABS6GLG1_9BACI|nr:flavodoxin [Allobacillus halotolerans]MBU6079966.1 flavodoxin [Allobacillus halotolerans]
MRVIIPYLSYSGNTKEVAELIEERLKKQNVFVDMHSIGISPPFDPMDYDLIFLGTFTWDYGGVPEEVKDFILEIGYKSDHIAVFGTGDTQFGGEELFCNAVNKLTKFYHSKWPGLKIEQSPRGSQEEKVHKWVEGVLQHGKIFA